jgi:hypothetical protein
MTNDVSYITFQVPDSVSISYPFSINDLLSVTGVSDARGQTMGFVRDAGGTITSFGACSSRTWPVSINLQGAVAGYCEAGGSGFMGFVRSPQGTIQAFNCPAIPGQSVQTYAYDVNLFGSVVGSCSSPDAPTTLHGYVRSQDGTFTQFDPPDSTSTQALRINASGLTAGVYTDATGVEHGFLRRSNGAFILFDLPGRIPTFGPFILTPPAFFLSEAGEISGTYTDSSHRDHGFVRPVQGAIVSFDVPGSIQTDAYGINIEGTIAGTYTDTNLVSHGFLRARQGAISTFDAPGSLATVAFAINDLGIVTGWFRPAQSPSTSMGYLRVPGPGNSGDAGK